MEHPSLNLRSINLNLLPVLRALLRHCSVTLAAREVGLSESATSTCLGQLRVLLDDPLLVKVGRGMKPTPRARALLEPVERICGDLGDLLQPIGFDPKSAERSFVVATPDYMSFVLGGPLLQQLGDEAPGVRVQFIDHAADLEDRLLSGEIDIGVLAVSRLSWSGFQAGPVTTDEYVVVVRDGHPLGKQDSVTTTDLASWRRADFSPGRISRNAKPERPASPLLVQHFVVLQLLALYSDTAVVTPRALATRMAALLPLTILELQHEMPPIDACVIWSPVHAADPGHRWFRTLVDETLQRAISGGEPARESSSLRLSIHRPNG